jgi:hypothetical protein
VPRRNKDGWKEREEGRKRGGTRERLKRRDFDLKKHRNK